MLRAQFKKRKIKFLVHYKARSLYTNFRTFKEVELYDLIPL